MRSGRGGYVVVEAQNPVTVCDPQALLVGALLSVGVPQHPAFPFTILSDESEGVPVTRWRWVLAEKSADGLYVTSDLIGWWNDPAWLAAHPAHEWAILRAGLHNLALVAQGIRAADPRAVVRHGKLEAQIPASASPARREHLLGQLYGRIPLTTRFVEPAPAALTP